MAADRLRKCGRCGAVLVAEDDQGWYFQTPVTDPEMPGMVFMDRVHTCDGKPHAILPSWPEIREGAAAGLDAASNRVGDAAVWLQGIDSPLTEAERESAREARRLISQIAVLIDQAREALYG